MRLIDADEYANCVIEHMTAPWDMAKKHISNDYDKGLYDAILLLNTTPTIYLEPHWIPCSERLPEEYGVYRITWTTSALKKCLVCDAEYESTYEWDAKRDKFKGKWLLDDFITAYYTNIKVIAWKPIEEPYAERREE